LSVPGYDPFATADDGYSFDAEEADRACDFFSRCLCHVKGVRFAGRPFDLEPWQRAIVGNLFGWRGIDGNRRYRETFIFVPRKNGKSALAAGIALRVLFADGEPGAEIYVAAADRDQAGIVFDLAKQQVAADDLLASQARCYRKSIVRGASTFKPVSSDVAGKHGYNAHCAIIDELHALPNGELVDVLQTSMGTRTQPLTVFITTSDFERPGSICNEKHEYASKVRDGVIDDPRFLPVIYEASRDADWSSPSTWHAANPNLGVSITEEFLDRECRKAQESPRYENTFKRLYLNIRTEQDVRFLSLEKWDAAGDPFDESDMDGRECVAGLDLASTTDIAALVLLFHDDDGGYHVISRFWVPQDGILKRSKKDRVPYDRWRDDGLLRATAGNVIDYEVIRADIRALGERFNIREIAIDRWNATGLATQLEGDGFAPVLFGQGFASMSAPTKEFEKLVLGEQLRHGGHAVLRWMASNVAVDEDAAGNLKPSKKRSAEKIDGIVAAVMALGRWIAGPRDPRTVYDTRGVLFL